jgi:hypothetical protein
MRYSVFVLSAALLPIVAELTLFLSVSAPSGVGSVITTSLAGSGASFAIVIVIATVSPSATGSGATARCSERLGRCGSSTAGAVNAAGAVGGSPSAPPAGAAGAIGAAGSGATTGAWGSQPASIISSSSRAAKRIERSNIVVLQARTVADYAAKQDVVAGTRAIAGMAEGAPCERCRPCAAPSRRRERECYEWSAIGCVAWRPKPFPMQRGQHREL